MVGTNRNKRKSTVNVGALHFRRKDDVIAEKTDRIENFHAFVRNFKNEIKWDI